MSGIVARYMATVTKVTSPALSPARIVSAHGGNAIGMEIFRRACKPAANVPAVTYRTGQIGILRLIQPDVMDPLIQDKPKAVFRAAAEIPMEWMGVGTPRHGLPFDAEDFLRRVREAA